MPHQCTIDPRKFDVKINRFSPWASRWLSLIVISAENPLCSLYFRSETLVRAQKVKQLNSKYPFIIHPLSRFREWYDVCILYIYVIMLTVKLLDFASGKSESRKIIFHCYPEFSLCCDVVSWINILMQFGMGYANSKKKFIEMRPSKIAWNYVSGPYFIADVLSSIPMYIKFYDYLLPFEEYTIRKLKGILHTFFLMKSIRIFTIIKLISKTGYRFRIRSNTTVFLITAVVSSLYVLHLATCMMMAVPRLSRYYFGTENYSQFLKHKQYVKAMFKSSACLLGIKYDSSAPTTIEDFIITIITYVFGKIITTLTWVVIAVSILNSRSITIKYQEMINQLNEYMRQKQLPQKLKNRILQFYTFKYQRKYFKEDLMNQMLTENLRNEINIHVCRSLIEQVMLFSDLTYNQVSAVVAMLVPEIFLPNDVIIQSGTNGDSMYFMSSGTVAVYTHSGKEICHLQDGAYFGEISLVIKDQSRTATIIAIEITQVYRLKRNDFEKTLAKYRSVFEAIIRRAEQRLKETLQMEECYKMAQFEKTYTKTSVTATAVRASLPMRLLQTIQTK